MSLSKLLCHSANWGVIQQIDVSFRKLGCHSGNCGVFQQIGVSFSKLGCHSGNWGVIQQIGVSFMKLGCHSANWGVIQQIGVLFRKLGCHSGNWGIIQQTGVFSKFHTADPQILRSTVQKFSHLGDLASGFCTPPEVKGTETHVFGIRCSGPARICAHSSLPVSIL